MAVLLCAPFEATRPLLQSPGQSLSTVEVLLLAALTAWGLALITARTFPVIDRRAALPAMALVLSLFAAALMAPAYRGNALHMAGRIGLALVLAVMTVNAVRTPESARRLLTAACASGGVVALLVMLDYSGWPRGQAWLAPFRVQVASVGAQVRASGPFQYPTITSMFLEIMFACGLALLPLAVVRRRPGTAVAIAFALVAMAWAVLLTYTRAGLITMATSTLLVAAWRWWRVGGDRGLRAVAAVGVALVVIVPLSRSADAMRLRLTTEQQDGWYQAAVDAPAAVTLAAGSRLTVPIRLTNTGHVRWDSSAARPFGVSYHWLMADSDRVVSWEGLRALFPHPIEPGEQITVPVVLEAPPQPGAFRVVWDLYEEHVLWFSTEPGAEVTVSTATVTGAATGPVIDVAQLKTMPVQATRPGRLLLWRAAAAMLRERPWFGVGPDNFRLLYGPYARLLRPDARVHTNNMYLELLVGGGLLAGLALVWLLVTAVRLTGQAVRLATDEERLAMATAAVAATAAIALHGLVDSFLGFTGTYAAIGIILGLLVASSRPEQTYAHRI